MTPVADVTPTSSLGTGGHPPLHRVWRQMGTFSIQAVKAGLEEKPHPRLLAVTGASNITGWLPPIEAIIGAARRRGIPVVLDAAQLAPHRPMPEDADFVAWSGREMYAPFGAGVLVGPRHAFTTGDPFLAGGGTVDLVDLDEVVWTDPPDREEAGSPNVIGAVALHAAIDAFGDLGWPSLVDHDRRLARQLRGGLASIPGVRLLGPSLDVETLPVAAFTVDDTPHALVAARLAAEDGIGVRHGCFCAHPYLIRLLGLSQADVVAYRDDVLRGDRSRMPGAVRASAGINTTEADVERLLAAVARIASGEDPPIEYRRIPTLAISRPILKWRPGALFLGSPDPGAHRASQGTDGVGLSCDRRPEYRGQKPHFRAVYRRRRRGFGCFQCTSTPSKPASSKRRAGGQEGSWSGTEESW